MIAWRSRVDDAGDPHVASIWEIAFAIAIVRFGLFRRANPDDRQCSAGRGFHVGRPCCGLSWRARSHPTCSITDAAGQSCRQRVEMGLGVAIGAIPLRLVTLPQPTQHVRRPTCCPAVLPHLRAGSDPRSYRLFHHRPSPWVKFIPPQGSLRHRLPGDHSDRRRRMPS